MNVQNVQKLSILGKYLNVTEMEEIQKAIETDVYLQEGVLQHAIDKLGSVLNKLKEHLSTKSRTAKMWIQYITYIDLAKAFIKAERTANWSAHLSSVSQMLHIFGATGHFNYAKSARLYLQMMKELPESHS